MGGCIVISGALPSIVYTDNEVQNTSVTTHTYTSKNIGTASSQRSVIVAVIYFGSSTSCTLTIAGIPATSVSAALGDFGTIHTRIFIASIPAGTTANIVATLSCAASFR